MFHTGNMKSNEKKDHIIQFLDASEDKELQKMKRTLTYNVPYRVQSPFTEGFSGEGWNVSNKTLAEKINRGNRLIYYFMKIDGLKSQVEVKKE